MLLAQSRIGELVRVRIVVLDSVVLKFKVTCKTCGNVRFQVRYTMCAALLSASKWAIWLPCSVEICR